MAPGPYISGSTNFLEFGSLIDGRYFKTVNGGALNLLFAGSGVGGASSSETFHRMFADVSGLPPGSPADGRVNPFDTIFYNDTLSNPGGSAYRFFFDFNNNGAFDPADQAARNIRNGQTLPAAL